MFFKTFCKNIVNLVEIMVQFNLQIYLSFISVNVDK